MSVHKTFAIAGTGNIGTEILKSLGETGKPVKVLTRSAATQLDKDVAARPNVTLAPVDYSSEASLVDALRGVDVVVSTLNGPGFAAQTDLIRAAKKADVKLFVASQFGIPVNGLEGTVMSAKVEANKLTKEIGLPSAQFATGPFMEFLRLALLGGNPSGKTFTVVGDGNTPLSTTSMSDIGRYVAHVLTTLPPDQLEWKEFRIQGELTTLTKVIAAIEQATGQHYEVVRRDLTTAKAELPQAKGLAALFDFIAVSLQDGLGNTAFDKVTGKTVPLDNGLFPGWNPRTFAQVAASADLK